MTKLKYLALFGFVGVPLLRITVHLLEATVMVHSIKPPILVAHYLFALVLSLPSAIFLTVKRDGTHRDYLLAIIPFVIVFSLASVAAYLGGSLRLDQPGRVANFLLDYVRYLIPIVASVAILQRMERTSVVTS
jgi:hypothetical protein